MSQPIYLYTLGIPTIGEVYHFNGESSKLGSVDQPIGQLFLTRPLIPIQNNPITQATPGTRFIKFVIRQYDRFNNLLKVVEYNNIYVLQLIDGPDLILEFTYKS